MLLYFSAAMLRLFDMPRHASQLRYRRDMMLPPTLLSACSVAMRLFPDAADASAPYALRQPPPLDVCRYAS